MYNRDEEDFNIDPFYENKNQYDDITYQMTYREPTYTRGDHHHPVHLIKESSLMDPIMLNNEMSSQLHSIACSRD